MASHPSRQPARRRIRRPRRAHQMLGRRSSCGKLRGRRSPGVTVQSVRDPQTTRVSGVGCSSLSSFVGRSSRSCWSGVRRARCVRRRRLWKTTASSCTRIIPGVHTPLAPHTILGHWEMRPTPLAAASSWPMRSSTASGPFPAHSRRGARESRFRDVSDPRSNERPSRAPRPVVSRH